MAVELLRRIDVSKAAMLRTVAFALEYETICTLAEHRLASLAPAAQCDDELVLEAAVNGRANAIVTFNESHLRNARNFGIEVIRPAEALGRIKK